MLGVIVCGGRHFNRYDVVEKVLNEVVSTCGDQEIEIVSGHCEGADRRKLTTLHLILSQ